MPSGIYVHIPYCLQRCVYCDFATYEFSQILKPEDYVSALVSEIRFQSKYMGPRKLETLYFGGGTPSLLEPALLEKIINCLGDSGFGIDAKSEVTIEINPATLTQNKINELVQIGFNRFSVGAQTFRDDLLQLAHRKHTSKDTLDTLGMIKDKDLPFSVDLLFALPKQSLGDLEKDLEMLLQFDPQHISPYCLTVPSSNPMAAHRPRDEIQIEMFKIIRGRLMERGYHPYEISNFAKDGHESRHNSLYWNDCSYWGVGLSSHSYRPDWGPWGTRFWNHRGIGDYLKAVESAQLPWQEAPNHERLLRHQSMTDFCHTSLRKASGLDLALFEKKFGVALEQVSAKEVERVTNLGWLRFNPALNTYSLTEEGILVSNKVFEEFTFLPTT